MKKLPRWPDAGWFIYVEKGLKAWQEWWKKHHHRKPKPKPAPKPTKIYMFDDVNVALIPADAEAVAGYVDGNWKTWELLHARFPKAKLLSIAVSVADDASCLDVEPGDARPDQAVAWVKRMRSKNRGVLTAWSKKPIPALYTNASSGQALIDECSRAGLRYGIDYLWWSAHYDAAKGEHLCGPGCGFGLKRTAHATQFTDHAQGKSLDESVCRPGFFA